MEAPPLLPLRPRSMPLCGTSPVQGLWPFSYNTCDDIAFNGQAAWSNSEVGRQNFSACETFTDAYGWVPYQGRGVPQADVLVSEVPTTDASLGYPWDGVRGAHIVSGLTLGPKIPPNTTHGGGTTGDCNATSANCTGIYLQREYRHDTGHVLRMRCGAVCCGVVWRCVVWCAEGAVTRKQWPGCLPMGTGKRAGLCVLCARCV